MKQAILTAPGATSNTKLRQPHERISKSVLEERVRRRGWVSFPLFNLQHEEDRVCLVSFTRPHIWSTPLVTLLLTRFSSRKHSEGSKIIMKDGLQLSLMETKL